MALTLLAGTATSQKNFLSQFEAWVSATLGGWTTEDYNTGINFDTGTKYDGEDQLSIRMGTECYFHFVTLADLVRPRMHFAPSLGLTPIGGPNLLPWEMPQGTDASGDGVSFQGVSIPPSGETFNFWLAADTNYIWLVFKMAGGWYQNAFVGKLSVFAGLADNAFLSAGCLATEDDPNILNGPPWDFDSLVGQGANMFHVCAGAPPGAVGSLGAGTDALYVDGEGEFRQCNAVNGSNPVNCSQWMGDFNGANNSSSRSCIGHYKWDSFTANLVQPLVETVYYVQSILVPGKTSFFGKLPGARYLNTKDIGEEFAGGAPLAIGGDNYYVFPAGKTRQVAHARRYAGLAVQIP